MVIRLDYHNSFYAYLPLKLIQKLQLIQVAAQILMGTLWRAHMQPVLHQLHWHPVKYRIRFKILVVIFKALRMQGSLALSPSIWSQEDAGLRVTCCLRLLPYL